MPVTGDENVEGGFLPQIYKFELCWFSTDVLKQLPSMDLSLSAIVHPASLSPIHRRDECRGGLKG